MYKQSYSCDKLHNTKYTFEENGTINKMYDIFVKIFLQDTQNANDSDDKQRHTVLKCHISEQK